MNAWSEIDGPEGTFRTLNTPFDIGRRGCGGRADRPPKTGQHTHEVLQELGLTDYETGGNWPRVERLASSWAGRWIVSEELDLIVNAVRRFVRRENLAAGKANRAETRRKLPADIHANLLNRAAELGIDHLMAPSGSGVGPGRSTCPTLIGLRIAEELSQHRAGVLNPAYGLFDPDPPPQLYAASAEQRERFPVAIVAARRLVLQRPR